MEFGPSALLHALRICFIERMAEEASVHHSRLPESQYCYQYGDAEVVRGRAAPWTPRYG